MNIDRKALSVPTFDRHWWAVRGSNPRPSRCKRDALPTELTARHAGGRANDGFSSRRQWGPTNVNDAGA